MQLSPFLRTILKLDAASCLVMAAALAPGAALLGSMLGIPAALLTSAGISLIPIGLFILWLGSRERAPSMLVYLVVAGNLGWTAASFVSLALLPDVLPFGLAVVTAQALAVAAFALLELRGARESQWASA
jgi:hypothetical protein